MNGDRFLATRCTSSGHSCPRSQWSGFPTAIRSGTRSGPDSFGER